MFNYTKLNNSRCPYCGFYKDGSIKTSSEYLNSFTFICKDTNYPKFLSFCFDLGNEYNFQPLFDKQKIIGNIIDERLIFGNVEYALCGLVVCPTPIRGQILKCPNRALARRMPWKISRYLPCHLFYTSR